MSKTCIIIAGPTAIGKTTLALEIANHFKTEIISADSRQCYKELNVGVAKPSTAQLASVHHYFINTNTIHENISAAYFESYALQAVHEVFLKNEVAVMVGGTGLYIKAFCEGLDLIPEIDDNIRTHIIKSYQQNGLDWLQQQVQEKDPEFFINGETGNPQRLMRALEVVLSSGRSIISFQSKSKKERDFKIIKIGLECSRDQLYERINIRVDQMIAAGLLDEVKMLVPFKHLNALQTVGYKELFSHLEGSISLQEAITLIKQHTRHYAKRQMTWFKKEDMAWINIEEENVLQKSLNYLHANP